MDSAIDMAEQTPARMQSFAIVWSGQALSLLGSQLVQFALAWWLTETTGSVTALALAGMMGMLPLILIGPFAGLVGDAVGARMWYLLAGVLIAASGTGAFFVPDIMRIEDQVRPTGGARDRASSD